MHPFILKCNKKRLIPINISGLLLSTMSVFPPECCCHDGLPFRCIHTYTVLWQHRLPKPYPLNSYYYHLLNGLSSSKSTSASSTSSTSFTSSFTSSLTSRRRLHNNHHINADRCCTISGGDSDVVGIVTCRVISRGVIKV